MIEEYQLDKAIAALKLGDVLLNNMDKEIKALKEQNLDIITLILERLSHQLF